MSAFVDEIKNADIKSIVDDYNFAEKIDRAKKLLEWAFEEYGDKAVVANSLGKDSMVVWDLATKVNPDARGFIVTTKFKPQETKDYMLDLVKEYPALKIYKSDTDVGNLYETDPDACCQILKVDPTRQAVEEMGVDLWITGLRCTEGRTRTDFKEIEERDKDLLKLNPILPLKEREVWQYLALNQVKTSPLYAQGYRSLGCSPCTHISTGENERAGRWLNTSKCGGECGIHTRPLKNWELAENV
ncbi:Sulfate adenylyltransferase subunit 2 [hydrothermal vent metagenome]|uniref:Sulfate adenylyltransferase subunit 2 n=1 Tax=hydrothermal vent metagenome TaxID=652676 RepID=A0A3B1CSX2_9ZZZZ